MTSTQVEVKGRVVRNREAGTSSARLAVAAVTMLFLVGLAFRLLLAAEFPLWQSPDEPKHFESARTVRDLRETLLSERRLTRLSDASPALQRAIIASMARNHYWDHLDQPVPKPLPASFYAIWRGSAAQLHRHSLYYVVSALALWPFEGRADVESELLVVRVISAILSALVIPVTYLAARRAAPGDRFVAYASAAFVAFLPMHIAIGGGANTDNMATLAGGVLALAAILAIRRGVSVRGLALVALSFAFALLSKRSAFGLAPAVVLVGAIWLGRQGPRVVAAILAGAALVAGVAFALAGASGASVLRTLRGVAAYWLNEPDQIDRVFRLVDIRSTETWRLVADHQLMYFRSFFGVFGWFHLPLDDSIYRALTWVCAVALVGIVAFLTRRTYEAVASRSTDARRDLLVVAFCLFAILGTTVLAEAERLSYFSAGEIPQGRYLFIAVTEFAILLAIGLRSFLPSRRFGVLVPAVIWTALLVALDFVVYFEYLRPHFIARSFPT